MSFKNAVKLTIAKFSLVWNVLLYCGIVFTFLFLIMYSMWHPAFVAMIESGYVAAIVSTLTNFFNGKIYIMEAVSLISATLGEIGETFLLYPASIVLTPVVIMLLGRILLGLKDLPVNACITAHMCSNMKLGFCEAFFSNFVRSVKLVLSRTLFTLPFDVVTILLMWGVSKGFSEGGISYASPFCLILIWVLMVSFKRLMFSLWPTYISAEDNHTFSAMRRSIKLATAYSNRFYSNWVVAAMISLALNVIVGIFTLGVGLMISIPLTLVFEQMLAMTLMFNHTQRRYYLDNGEVFVPEGAPSIDKAEVAYLVETPVPPDKKTDDGAKS